MSTATFAQSPPPTNTPPNFSANVVFPPSGNFVYGGTFVLSSPVTPSVGGPTTNTPAPGVSLANVACEIGDECYVVPPPNCQTGIGCVPPTFAAAFAGVNAFLIYEIIRSGRSNGPAPASP